MLIKKKANSRKIYSVSFYSCDIKYIYIQPQCISMDIKVCSKIIGMSMSHRYQTSGHRDSGYFRRGDRMLFGAFTCAFDTHSSPSLSLPPPCSPPFLLPFYPFFLSFLDLQQTKLQGKHILNLDGTYMGVCYIIFCMFEKFCRKPNILCFPFE